MAPDFIPDIAKDRNYYLKEFLEIVKRTSRNKTLTQPQPLIKAQYKNKILHIES